MKNLILSCFVFTIILIISSCSNQPAPKLSDAAAQLKTVVKHDTDAELSHQIVGLWDAIETARGESLMFDSSGKYSGYDGRTEFKGNWKIQDQKITLSTGGAYKLVIHQDTMYMDENKYLRNNKSLTEK